MPLCLTGAARSDGLSRRSRGQRLLPLLWLAPAVLWLVGSCHISRLSPSLPRPAAYGDYFNGEPGRPLLVSLLLYLNPEWERDWGADTLFLDGATDTGCLLRCCYL